MSQVYSKLTSKAQTTVPKEVRRALDLKPGDALSYEVSDDGVVLSKAEAVDVAYLKAVQNTLSEWDSPQDAAAYDDL